MRRDKVCSNGGIVGEEQRKKKKARVVNYSYGGGTEPNDGAWSMNP